MALSTKGATPPPHTTASHRAADDAAAEAAQGRQDAADDAKADDAKAAAADAPAPGPALTGGTPGASATNPALVANDPPKDTPMHGGGPVTQG